MKKLSKFVDTRIGFFTLLVVLFWLKTLFAYFTDFKLGAEGIFQYLILLINPLPITALIYSIAFYFKRSRFFYPVLMGLDIANTLLLYLNVIYYREFTDFMTIATMTGYSKVNQGLSGSSLALTNVHDLFYWLDIVIIIILMLLHKIHFDPRAISSKLAFAFTSMALTLFGINLSLAEMSRPQLLTRTFDRTYIVKYLGIDAFTGYDVVKSQHINKMRQSATKSELLKVKKFTDKHYASPNPKLYGIAKGRNVIVIHLESFQQFLIDKKVNGQEVTPFLNSLYHGSDTYAFDNFFHQVGQGKTADAETMLENSLFGLPEGSAMVTDGTTNTFQSAPALLHQKLGYTTASFHGDVPSFWNRDNAYKSFGYQYFFSKEYYPKTKDYDAGYGMKDKIFMKESAHYIEQLPQPFYAKIITVTNHYPYILDKKNKDIEAWKTGDDTVDPYIQTARYLDESLGEFLDYLDKTGLRQNSVLVLYGDHYGISNNHQPAIAQILGKKKVTNYDLAMFQKVPFMINMPGLKGGINHTYGGEIDVLPTLEDLLGISSKNYIQFGQDLLSPENKQIVPFRNGDWVTPKYTKYNGDYYYTKNGKQITHQTAAQRKEIGKIQKYVTTDLGLSDKVVNGDLLRFYKLPGFKKVDKKQYTYNLKKSLKNLQKQQKKQKTSLKSENNNQSTFDDYTTDAPELKNYPKLNFPKP